MNLVRSPWTKRSQGIERCSPNKGRMLDTVHGRVSAGNKALSSVGDRCLVLVTDRCTETRL